MVRSRTSTSSARTLPRKRRCIRTGGAGCQAFDGTEKATLSMDYTTLGRTNLKVSVAGLGSGGGSQLGLDRGKSRQEAADIVRLALDLGVNVIDTAEAYMTEELIGEALAGRDRQAVILSTKHHVAPYRKNNELYTPEQVVAGLDEVTAPFEDGLYRRLLSPCLDHATHGSCDPRARTGSIQGARQGKIPLPRRNRGTNGGTAASGHACGDRNGFLRCRDGSASRCSIRTPASSFSQ